MTARPITETVLRPNSRTRKSSDISTSYLIPDQKCASCGESTVKAWHWDCERDMTGRLLVDGVSTLMARREQ
jgi:hypothetical protein